ncbi:MAG TPA: hypothetical protein VNI57_03250 [Candidatus Saccharimonadales bacterium]|nr:hypothetical protein [Candidatus Saccharimonadales bacterium]
MARLLSIAAPANGSGKTSLIVTLLRANPGVFTALKASTVYRDGRHCPRTGSGCACRRLEGDYTVITDPGVIGQPGTDTGRMKEAGAVRTLWSLARPGSHAELWSHLSRAVLGDHEPVLCEGTGIIDLARPESIVMVVRPGPSRDRWKAGTWSLMERASLVVVNAAPGEAPGETVPARDLAGEIRARTATPVIVEDVTRPLDLWRSSTLRDLCARLAPVRPGS